MISFDIFAWFDRIRRALQNCDYSKSLKLLFCDKKSKKLLAKFKKMLKNSFFHTEGKHSIFSIKLASFHTYTDRDTSKDTHLMQREKLRLANIFSMFSVRENSKRC